MELHDLIETPENVELKQWLAGIGSRFIAGLLDHLLIFAMYVGVFLVFVLPALALGVANDSLGMILLAIVIFVYAAIYWGYFLICELRMNGQTIGKRRAKIRVVRKGGGPVGFTEILLRTLLRPIDGMGAYGLAGFVMFATRRCQRLGDLAAGTVVVSEERMQPQTEAQIEAEARAARHVEPQGGPLTPEEYRVVQRYISRRHELTEQARTRVAATIARPIVKRRGEALPNWSVAAVEQYLGELRVRTERGDTQGGPT